jgi:hypothetical protein
MAEALGEVRQSLDRCVAAKKRGPAEKQLQRLTACIDRGLDLVADMQAKIRQDVAKVRAVAETLDPA